MYNNIKGQIIKIQGKTGEIGEIHKFQAEINGLNQGIIDFINTYKIDGNNSTINSVSRKFELLKEFESQFTVKTTEYFNLLKEKIETLQAILKESTNLQSKLKNKQQNTIPNSLRSAFDISINGLQSIIDNYSKLNQENIQAQFGEQFITKYEELKTELVRKFIEKYNNLLTKKTNILNKLNIKQTNDKILSNAKNILQFYINLNKKLERNNYNSIELKNIYNKYTGEIQNKERGEISSKLSNLISNRQDKIKKQTANLAKMEQHFKEILNKLTELTANIVSGESEESLFTNPSEITSESSLSAFSNNQPLNYLSHPNLNLQILI